MATMDHIVQTLFPTHPIRTKAVFDDVADIPLFSQQELYESSLTRPDMFRLEVSEEQESADRMAFPMKF